MFNVYNQVTLIFGLDNKRNTEDNGRMSLRVYSVLFWVFSNTSHLFTHLFVYLSKLFVVLILWYVD